MLSLHDENVTDNFYIWLIIKIYVTMPWIMVKMYHSKNSMKGNCFPSGIVIILCFIHTTQRRKKGNVISVFIQNYILSVTVRHIPSHYHLFNSVFKDLSTITNLFDCKIRFLSLSNVSYICFWYTKWHFFAFIHPNMLCYRYGAIVTWWNPKILKSAIFPLR